MSKLIIFGSFLVGALILSTTPTLADAHTYDKLTYLTFSEPVQIPGVTLGAGTYRFRLANPETSRNVLQVLSNDGTIVYAMFHTTPDSRMTVTEESMVTFRETPVGVAPAVRSLFYGGEYRGYEFVYPRGGPDMTGRLSAPPEIAYTAMPAAIPEPAAEPAPAPVVPERAAEPAPASLASEPVGELALAPAAPELPQTASPLPLVGVSGLGALVLGLGAGLLRRHLT